MRLNSPYLIIILVFVAGVSFAQSKMFANKAESHEARNHYYEASRMYRGFHDRGDRESALKAAMNLYKAHRYEEALPYFHLSDSIALIDDVDEIFAYFECLKAAKKYEAADKLVKTHVKNFSNKREFTLHEDKLDYYDKLASYKSVKITPLPFNSAYSDISPTLYNNWIYFVSTRPATHNKEVHRLNNQPFYNLYGTPLTSDMKKAIKPAGKFAEPEKTISYQGIEAGSLPNGINKKYHDGPIYVAPSGKILFFTTNWSKEKRPKSKITDINLMIYYCTKQGDTWSEPMPLPFNSFSYHTQHAFYDEKNSTLFFSSDMPKGFGSFDIWKATFKNGQWSKPVNLGEKVNTPREEVFPSLAPDGSLIISSNGWPGLGGLDVFMSPDPNEEPINLTGGLNTERDEFGLYFTSRTLAYMTSNRIGSVGDDDIYGVEIDLDDIKAFMGPPDRILDLIVYDEATKKPLENVKVSVSGYFNKNYLTPAGQLLDTLGFKEIDPKATGMVLNFEKPGYESRKISIGAWPEDRPVVSIKTNLTPIKKEEPIVQVRMLDNQKFIIYYDFDKFNIRKDAAEILAKVAYVLLEEYEAAQVLLTGHTDTRGSIQYNTNLSRNRVESAKKWLIDRGVNPNRIRTAYKGEIQLAVYCKNAFTAEADVDRCLSEAEHQLNRRVEIEILNQTN